MFNDLFSSVLFFFLFCPFITLLVVFSLRLECSFEYMYEIQ